MLEFTGERVVPGLSDPNLLNEHKARYRLAAHVLRSLLPAGAAVLDAGCGAGYGSAEFPDAGSVTAMDISAEAVMHARANFGTPRIHFLQAGCESLPFADCSFDLIAAFEVIEHLERWPEFLDEARRVLKPGGMLLVSTPNKAVYAEARAGAGPNPFHVREFEFDEYREVLEAVFPHVKIWSQNHTEAIGFLPAGTAAGALDAAGDNAPATAMFFLAACSKAALPDLKAFAYLPASGNLLRERERHIELLLEELESKTGWLNELEKTHTSLVETHKGVISELQQHNRWADELNLELNQARERITELQQENTSIHERYRDHTAILEQEAAARSAWIQNLDTQMAVARAEIERVNEELRHVGAIYREREAWGQEQSAELVRTREKLEKKTAEFAVTEAELNQTNSELSARLDQVQAELNARLDSAQAELAAAAQSKWVRLGNSVGLGPKIGLKIGNE